MKITIEDYRDMCNNYEGWCTTCQEFTALEVEPDAQGYPCEVCGENTVMGTEEALMCGEIEVE
jgi:hypothetical protein